MAFGQRKLNGGGRVLPALSDGVGEWKIGGITLAWDTVPANPTTVTLADDNVATAGVKYLPTGIVLAQITAAGATQGMYGPHDPAALDGRQALTRGRCFILNTTVMQDEGDADHPAGCFDGGNVYEARIKSLVGGVYTAGWTAAMAAAFPRIRLTGGY